MKDKAQNIPILILLMIIIYYISIRFFDNLRTKKEVLVSFLVLYYFKREKKVVHVTELYLKYVIYEKGKTQHTVVYSI